MRDRKIDNRMIGVQGIHGRTDIYVLDTMTSIGEDKVKNISFSMGWFVN